MRTRITRTGTDGSIEVLTVYGDGSKDEYEKDIDGSEQWWKYDQNNNLIHYKDSNDEYDYEYDENNNEISRTDSNGCKQEMVYDERNNLISRTDNNGLKQEWVYDERNNEIHFKHDSYERWKEYDENNRCIYFKDNKSEISYTYETIII